MHVVDVQTDYRRLYVDQSKQSRAISVTSITAVFL